MVDHESLSGLEHHVVGIFRLGDPHGAVEARHGQAIGVVEADDLVFREIQGCFGEAQGHGALLLHEISAC